MDGKLYFHCASEGLKLDLLKANANVCIEVETDVAVVPNDKPSLWSARYRSVIGFGRATIVESADEKRAGVQALFAQYTDQSIEIPQPLPPGVVIFRVDINSLTGKQALDS